MSSFRLLFCHFIVTLTIGGYQDCGYHFDHENVTFDLSPLTLTQLSPIEYYSILDEPYKYMFNLCADVVNASSIPSECTFGDDLYFDKERIERTRPGNTSSQAFQYDNLNSFCFRLSGSHTETQYNVSKNLISYDLYDPNDPALGIIVHNYYGDQGCQTNREFDIIFICDPAVDNIPDSGETVSEPINCQYNLEIKNIYGCPLECNRGINGSLCSDVGECRYDFQQQTARCFCYAGYDGDACERKTPFLGQKAWYDAIQTDNASVVVQFETIYGYNVTYDLQYILDGYLDDKFYKLHNSDNTDTIYFNLFDSFTNSSDKIQNNLCMNNANNYDYGYIFDTITDAPGAQCYSLGRDKPIVEVYDTSLPTKGIKISFQNGDDLSGSCPSGTSATVYFICPDSNQFERYDGVNGLNDIFDQYKFSELFNCQRQIEIFTSVACPFQCITYDDKKDAISQCSNNGVCGYDFALDTMRCFCNENVNVTAPEHIFCDHPSVTHVPTLQPTKEPTLPPYITYYQDVEVDTNSSYLYEFQTVYKYNITYDLQYIVQGLTDKWYKFYDGSKFSYYVNLFNKIEPSSVQGLGICDNNIATYEYGYAFQAVEGDSSKTCFSLGTIGPIISLLDEKYPEKGIKVSFEMGDHAQSINERRSDINLICPDDGGTFEEYSSSNGLQDIFAINSAVDETNYEYEINILTAAACPAKCITYDESKDAISVCLANGNCTYSTAFGLVKCDCFDDYPITSPNDIFCPSNLTYSPSNDPTQSPTNEPTLTPTISPTFPPFLQQYYRNNQPDKTSPHVFTFVGDTYNISYNLEYIIQGYLLENGKRYYKLTDNTNEHYFYFNLFNSTIGDDDVIYSCSSTNPSNYEYGYIYQSHIYDSNVRCNSLGIKGPLIELYNIDKPLNGIKITYELGESRGCPDGQKRKSQINFVCPNDNSNNEYEIYQNEYGLNNIFSQYIFSENSTCQYSVTIYTAAACPYQCAYYEPNKPSISLCNNNGMCIFDSQINVVRCQCDAGIIMDTSDDVYCAENVSYSPTQLPTAEPTNKPSSAPTRTRHPTNDPTNSPTERYGLTGTWNHYNPSDDISWKVSIDTDYHCEYVKFTIIIPNHCENVNDNMWFGFGMGGNYNINSENKMDGYALITITGNKTFETTLISGTRPIPQAHQDLNCDITINNCIQTTICYRKLFDDDTLDFDQFTEGYNRIIYAYGTISDGIMNKHMYASGHKKDNIYLDGDVSCFEEQIVTEKPESTEEINYSLKGYWTRLEPKYDLTLQFGIVIGSECEYIKFTFISATCDIIWFSIGMGGSYNNESSEKMNGYAIVSFIDEIYETTLKSGAFPTAQTTQNLRNCTIKRDNCVQTINCYRDYNTNNTDDFYKFVHGINPIIYAFGSLNENNNLPNKHIKSGNDFIYLKSNDNNNNNLCGYAQNIQNITSISSADEGSKAWTIVAIIFIALFILICLVMLIFWDKHKNPLNPREQYTHGRVPSTDLYNDTGGMTQLTSIDEDDQDLL